MTADVMMVAATHFMWNAFVFLLVCLVMFALVLSVMRVDEDDFHDQFEAGRTMKGPMKDERKTYEKQLSIARTAYEASVQLGDHASAQLNAESMAAAHRRLALLDEQERKQREGEGVV